MAPPRWSPRMRAMMSVGPAGANGTMILTVRSGYPAASARVGPRLELAAAPIARLATRRTSRRDGCADFFPDMVFPPTWFCFFYRSIVWGFIRAFPQVVGFD